MLNDPKTIWKNQRTESTQMSLEQIRAKARELHAKTRRDLQANTAVPIFAAGLCGIGVWVKDDSIQLGLAAIGIAWALAGAVAVNRDLRLDAFPQDAPAAKGLDYYKSLVERRRVLFVRSLTWSIGPMVFAIAAFLASTVSSGQLSVKVLPFALLALSWTVAVLVIRSRRLSEMRSELQSLG